MFAYENADCDMEAVEDQAKEILGTPDLMAKQSTGFAGHYQAVYKTTGLRKISKEILAKRGLLSCVDYYLN